MLCDLLLRQLNELRRNKVLCDLELISTDKTSILVHKVVLTAFNKNHFQQALKKAIIARPLSMGKMFFSSISGEELNILVEFLYGETINKQSKYDSLISTLNKLEMTYLLEEAGEFALENDYTIKTETDSDIVNSDSEHSTVSHSKSNKEIIEDIHSINATESNVLSVSHDSIKSEVPFIDNVQNGKQQLTAEENAPKDADDSLKSLTPERDIISNERCILNHETQMFDRNCEQSGTIHTDNQQEICSVEESCSNYLTNKNNGILNEQQELENRTTGNGSMIDSVQIKNEPGSAQISCDNSPIMGNDGRPAERQLFENVCRIFETNSGMEVANFISVKEEPGTADSNGRTFNSQNENQFNNTSLNDKHAFVNGTMEQTVTTDTSQIKQDIELNNSVSNSNKNSNDANNEIREVSVQTVPEPNSNDFQSNENLKLTEVCQDIKSEVNRVSVCQNDLENGRENKIMSNYNQNNESDNEVKFGEMSPLGNSLKYAWTGDCDMDKLSKENADNACNSNVSKDTSTGIKQNSILSPTKKLKSLLPKLDTSAIQLIKRKDEEVTDLISSKAPTIPRNTITSSRVVLLSKPESTLLNSSIQTYAPPTIMISSQKHLTLNSKENSTLLPFEPNICSPLAGNASLASVSILDSVKQPSILTMPSKTVELVSLLNSGIEPVCKQVPVLQSFSVPFQCRKSFEFGRNLDSSSNLISMTHTPCSTTMTYALCNSAMKYSSCSSTVTSVSCFTAVTSAPCSLTLAYASCNSIKQPSLPAMPSETDALVSTSIYASCRPIMTYSSQSPALTNASESSTLKIFSSSPAMTYSLQSPTLTYVSSCRPTMTYAVCGSLVTNVSCSTALTPVSCFTTLSKASCSLSIMPAACSTTMTNVSCSSALAHATCNISTMPAPCLSQTSAMPAPCLLQTSVIEGNSSIDGDEEQIQNMQKEVLQIDMVKRKPLFKKSRKVEVNLMDENQSVKEISDEDVENEDLKQSNSPIFEKDDGTQTTDLKETDVLVESAAAFLKISEIHNVKIEDDKFVKAENEITDCMIEGDGCAFENKMQGKKAASMITDETKYDRFGSDINVNVNDHEMHNDVFNATINYSETQFEELEQAVGNDNNLNTSFNDSDTPIKSTSKKCIIPSAEVLKLTHNDLIAAKRKPRYKEKPTKSKEIKKKKIKKAAVFQTPEVIVKKNIDNTVEIGKIESVQNKSCQMSSVKILQVKSSISSEEQEAITSNNDGVDEIRQNGEIDEFLKSDLVFFSKEIEGVQSKKSEKELDCKGKSEMRPCAVFVKQVESDYLGQKYNFELQNRNGMNNKRCTGTNDDIIENCAKMRDKSNGPELGFTKTNDNLLLHVHKISPKHLINKNLPDDMNTIGKEKGHLKENVVLNGQQDRTNCSNESERELGTQSNTNNIVFPTGKYQIETELNESTDEKEKVIDNSVEMGKTESCQMPFVKVLQVKSKISIFEDQETVKSSNDSVEKNLIDYMDTFSKNKEQLVENAVSNGQKDCFNESEKEPGTVSNTNDIVLPSGIDETDIETGLDEISEEIIDNLFQHGSNFVDQNKEMFKSLDKGINAMKKISINESIPKIQSNNIQGPKNERFEAVESTFPSNTITNKVVRNDVKKTAVPNILKHSDRQKQVSVANNTTLTSLSSQNAVRMTTAKPSSIDKNFLPNIPVFMTRFPLALKFFGPSNKIGLCPVDEPVVTRTYITQNENFSDMVENASNARKRKGNGSEEKRKRHKSVPENTSLVTKKKMKRCGSQEFLKVKRQESKLSAVDCNLKKKKMNKISVTEVPTDDDYENMEFRKSNECFQQRLGLSESDTDVDLPLSKLKEKLTAGKEPSFEQSLEIFNQSIDMENNDKDSVKAVSVFQNVYDNVITNNVLEVSDFGKSEENLEILLTSENTNNAQDLRNRVEKLKSYTKLGDTDRNRNIECMEGKECKSRKDDNLLYSLMSEENMESKEIIGINNDRGVRKCSQVIGNEEVSYEKTDNRSIITDNIFVNASCSPEMKAGTKVEHSIAKQVEVIDLTRHDNGTELISFGIPGVIQESFSKVLQESTPELRKVLNSPALMSDSVKCINCKKRETSCKSGSVSFKARSCARCFVRKDEQRLKQLKKREKRELHKKVVKDAYAEQKSILKKMRAIEKAKKADMRVQSQRKKSLKVEKMAKSKKHSNAVSDESLIPVMKVNKLSTCKEHLQERQMSFSKLGQNKDKKNHVQSFLSEIVTESSTPSSVVSPRPILPKLSFPLHVSRCQSQKVVQLQNMFHLASHVATSQPASDDTLNTVSSLENATVTQSAMSSISSSPISVSATCTSLMSSAVNRESIFRPQFSGLSPANVQPQIIVIPANLIPPIKDSVLSTPSSIKSSNYKKVLPKPVFPPQTCLILSEVSLGSEEINRPSPVQTMSHSASPVSSPLLMSSSSALVPSQVPSSPALSALLASKPVAPPPRAADLMFKSSQEQ